MTEREGCSLLKAAFEAAGYRITEDVPFDEAGVRFTLDGFDAQARVGYEFLTREGQDHLEFTDAVVAQLEARIERGELWLLLVDERDVDSARLTDVARMFLEHVSRDRNAT